MRPKLPGAVRRAVAPRVDQFVVRRYRTLAAQRTRSSDLERATVRAFRALADADVSRDRPSAAVRRAVVEQFHRLYYHSSKQTWQNTELLGARVWKNPMDLWLLWSPRVPVGWHIVVEDTHAGGHPVTTRIGLGPWAAVKRFLAEDDKFVVDESMHKFFFTFNPRGYLERVR